MLRFLEDPFIPPDNNASVRAIRNVKVKTKVSRMFKSEIGTDQFTVTRSVIDTFIIDKPTSLVSSLKRAHYPSCFTPKRLNI